MKLATYSIEGGPPRIGMVVEEGLVDLDGDGERPAHPRGMMDLIRGGQAAIDMAVRAAAKRRPIPLTSVRLLAPIPQPPEFMQLGGTYLDHLQEAGMKPFADPIVTSKIISCINGPFDDVELP